MSVRQTGEAKFQAKLKLSIVQVKTLASCSLKVYRSGGTIQGKDLEITAEQMQRELGLGVHS